MDYFRYLDPRPQTPHDWLILICTAVALAVIWVFPLFDTFRTAKRLIYSGIVCIAFGAAGAIYNYTTYGPLAGIILGAICIFVAVRLLVQFSSGSCRRVALIDIQTALMPASINMTFPGPPVTGKKLLPEKIKGGNC